MKNAHERGYRDEFIGMEWRGGDRGHQHCNLGQALVFILLATQQGG